ncbi:MAG: DUF721 domain-containing protein [Fervidobacterium sp.]|jgi:predicted nucleic acid-binding Zn ribbon protein
MYTIKNAIKDLSKSNPFFEKLYILSTLTEKSEEILGSISKHVKFVDYKGRILYVECDDFIWANELRKMTRQIKKKITAKIQMDIENIHITTINTQ